MDVGLIDVYLLFYWVWFCVALFRPCGVAFLPGS